MNKLNFNPKPTFDFPVKIQIPGTDEPAQLKMTFNHMKPKRWNEIYTETQAKIVAAKDNEAQLSAMVEAIKELATGWEWKQEFNDENIRATLENYPSFYASMISQYGGELWGVRAKS